MIEKALYIMIFLYALSFAALGVQFTLFDAFGIQLTNFEGVPIQSNLLGIVDVAQLNISTENLVTANQTQMGLEPIVSAAGLVVEIFLLLTGTYIFNVILLITGVDTIWMVGFVILYFILLMRTIIAYLRGI